MTFRFPLKYQYLDLISNNGRIKDTYNVLAPVTGLREAIHR